MWAEMGAMRRRVLSGARQRGERCRAHKGRKREIKKTEAGVRISFCFPFSFPSSADVRLGLSMATRAQALDSSQGLSSPATGLSNS